MENLSGWVPDKAYGVLQREVASSPIEDAVLQIRRLGYATLDAGLDQEQIDEIARAFDAVYAGYVAQWGEDRLRSLDELYTIRALLTQGQAVFRRLAMNEKLLSALQSLIEGKFTLNQQNGIINPPGKTYNQASWHRDLPYQHFVSNTPLAINALYCVDDFRLENGATFVLPASHRFPSFPSQNYIEKHAVQIEAKAGEFILLDCMLFHSGGRNNSAKARRAINHVYNIPYFKQQIRLPEGLLEEDLSEAEKAMFGFDYQEPASVEEYLASRTPAHALQRQEPSHGQ